MKMIKDKTDETMLEEAAESKEYQKHEIEDAAHTLTKAEEIKANKKLHGHAMDHLAKKSVHISAAMKVMKKPGSLAELKKMAHASGKAAAEIEE
jgi:hypothetical protein